MLATRSLAAACPQPAPRSETNAARRSIGGLSQLLGFRFRRIHIHLSTGLSRLWALEGSQPGELSALAIIQANPGMSQIELCTEMEWEKVKTVRVVHALERKGWARRARYREDRRRNTLHITDQGEAVLKRWIAVARENERPVRDVLTPEEFAQLSMLLDRIYDRRRRDL